MSTRRQMMAGILAIMVIATLGATAARDAAPARSEPRIWLDPNASDRLLASRLNLTNIAKTPLAP